MASSQNFIAGYRNGHRTFGPAHGTKVFPLWVPGTGGSRLHAILAKNNDTTNPVLFHVAWAKVLFTSHAGGVLTLTNATTITLSGGDSFLAPSATAGAVTDMAEFLGGENVAVLGNAPTVANRGANGRLQAVPTATVLTFPAATFVTPGEVLPTGTKLVQIGAGAAVNVRANAGQASNVSPHNILTQQVMEQLAAQPDNNDVMDGKTILVGWCNTTLGAGRYLDITVKGGDY